MMCRRLALAVAVVARTPVTVTLAVMAAALALTAQSPLIRAGARYYLRAMPVARQRAAAGDLPEVEVAVERWAVTLPEAPPEREAQEKTLPTTTILRRLTAVVAAAALGALAAGLRRRAAPAVAVREQTPLRQERQGR
tara:strand:+ start:575 stop:988 length:414 start_codon:yes stop_codon:yes gene_type:complete